MDYNTTSSSSSSRRRGGHSWTRWVMDTEAGTATAIFLGVLVGGAILGAIIPPEGGLPSPWDKISSLTGWIYFLAWSISFYPQLISNYSRKSVVGLSFDYTVLNMLGYICYSVFNCVLLYNNTIVAAYKAGHDGNAPAVRSNDVFFALHAAALTLICIVQIFMYERGGQTVSKLCRVFLVILILLIACYALVVGTNPDQTDAKNGSGSRSWLGFITFLSYVKLSITLSKYTPQVFLNYRRKSTLGWPIYNVLLDFVGGLLSLAQLLMDCAVTSDWSGIAGDPVKFGLGFVSMVYDTIFMVQHYLLYPTTASSSKNEGGKGSDDDDGSIIVENELGNRKEETAGLLSSVTV